MGQTQKTVTIKVVPSKVMRPGGDLTIFEIELELDDPEEGRGGSWSEVYGSIEIAEAFLRGVIAGSSMNGGPVLLIPGVSEIGEKEVETTLPD